MEKRTAILVRCTEAEAEMIRRAAKRERRTISGFILNAVTNRIQTVAKLEAQFAREGYEPGSPGEKQERKP